MYYDWNVSNFLHNTLTNDIYHNDDTKDEI